MGNAIRHNAIVSSTSHSGTTTTIANIGTINYTEVNAGVGTTSATKTFTNSLPAGTYLLRIYSKITTAFTKTGGELSTIVQTSNALTNATAYITSTVLNSVFVNDAAGAVEGSSAISSIDVIVYTDVNISGHFTAGVITFYIEYATIPTLP